ncbi:MAG: M23 family metallopeptidase [Rhodospirillaceae bacterium]
MSAAAARGADAPRLGLPIACTPGADCWVVNLVDHDASKGMKDFRCADHGYDGHKGTDIAIRDMAAMDAGVAVLAAAPGTVKALRDGMSDGVPSAKFRREAGNLYCGNGVVVVHDGGWETQYCHMRRGSIAVRKGDAVTRGQRLGYVGHSGIAMFPHVHLSVRREGRVVDPFVGSTRAEACAPGPHPLWTDAAASALAVPMTAIYSAGFAPTPPKAEAVRKGLYRAEALSRRAPALLLWAEAFWVDKGDRLTLTITGPGGATVMTRTHTLPKRQARRMIFAGRKKPGLFWPAGAYTGAVTLERTGADGAVQRFEAVRKVELKD